jgi:NAD(P)-dependent dehydrogenase (short-subunit alcohol dehydrogenase family)
MDMSKLTQPSVSVREQFDLTDKVVVITGGAGFLGRHFADAIAEMGGRPVLLDIDASSLAEARRDLVERGYVAAAHALDLTSTDAVFKTVEAICAECGKIDVLINCAAFAMKNFQDSKKNFFAMFEEYDLDLWRQSLDVTLTGTFLMTQAVSRVMKRQGKGSIINIASDVAVISPDHRIYQADERFDYRGVSFNTPPGYPVAKAGILSLTRYLATYWAKDGIRVNAISPAGVFRGHDSKFVEQLAYRIPLGRMAFPQELKGPIVFLASEASSFITGANLMVDGGRTIW